MVIKSCVVCGINFKLPLCDSNRIKCCSRECGNINRRGKPSWNKGKKGIYSEQSLKKMHDARVGKYGGEKHPMYHKHHSEETRKLQSEQKLKNPSRYWKGKKLPNHVIELLSKRQKGHWLGENNPNWANGKSWEDYPKEFNTNFKLFIRERDNFRCVRCNMPEEESVRLFHRKLHIHHIDYDKKNTIIENCCCLCNKCNAKVNFNRNVWTPIFQSLLTEKYSYGNSKMVTELDTKEEVILL